MIPNQTKYSNLTKLNIVKKVKTTKHKENPSLQLAAARNNWGGILMTDTIRIESSEAQSKSTKYMIPNQTKYSNLTKHNIFKEVKTAKHTR